MDHRIILETKSLPGVEPAHTHRTLARLTAGGMIYVSLDEVIPCDSCDTQWSLDYWTLEATIKAERQLAREQAEREQLIEDEGL